LNAPESGACELEIWSYSPQLFAEENFVDKFSLYLSLRETNDERVEMALQQMMRAIS
jgi:hypothetical protein